MESIDDLLAKVKADYAAKSPASSYLPSTLPSTEPAGTLGGSRPPTSGGVESLLADLGDEYRQKEQAEARERQQREEEQRRQHERVKQQQRQALRSDAEAWLKKLAPLSAEGLWFAEFAEGYTSRLEAAIDYLEALKEVQL